MASFEVMKKRATHRTVARREARRRARSMEVYRNIRVELIMIAISETVARAQANPMKPGP